MPKESHNQIFNSFIPESRRDGFTLIEALLGLLLFSLISICTYATLSSGMVLSRKFDQQKNISRQVQMALDILSTEIENAVLYDFSLSYPGHSAFDGTRDKIVFIRRDKAGLKVVSYYLMPQDKLRVNMTIMGAHYQRNVNVTQMKSTDVAAFSLFREETDLADYLSGDLQMRGDKEVVLKDVVADGIQFTFSKGAGDDGQLAWQPDWKDARLPSAVQVTVAMPGESGGSNRVFAFKRTIVSPTALKI